MGTISNNVRAVMYHGDITNSLNSPTKADVYTLQEYSYVCRRERDSYGLPYGPSRLSLLKMKIRALPDGCLEGLYRALKENNPQPYSIIFNAVFSEEDGQISDYDSASLVRGYVVTIEESFATAEAGPMTLEVEILPVTVSAIGDGESIQF